MERIPRGICGLMAAFVTAAMLVAVRPVTADIGKGAPAAVQMCAVSSFTLALEDQPFERQVGGITRTVLRSIRWSFRILRWMFWRAATWWAWAFKRALFPLGVAVVAALADASLVTTWRAEGLKPLLTYSLLMLYVYARLLFSSAVNLAPKLLLAGALVYGIARRDLMPDRTVWPGRIDDVLVMVIATRAFVYACPEMAVNEYAERAMQWKRRLRAVPRAH
jgi:uncharacterized membrane protein YkvA (DUF1232 family)